MRCKLILHELLSALIIQKKVEQTSMWSQGMEIIDKEGESRQIDPLLLALIIGRLQWTVGEILFHISPQQKDMCQFFQLHSTVRCSLVGYEKDERWRNTDRQRKREELENSE